VEEQAHRIPPFGASETFRSIYEECYPRVLAYCARRVGRDNAPDVAADVFAVAWRRFDAVPRGEESLPWLYGVAYRVVMHHHRSGDRSRRLTKKLASSPAPAVVGPETHLVQREEYELVLAAVARLRRIDQEVLLLSVWEELGNEEIAVALGSTVPAIRQRFHRAKRALRREFERMGGTLPPRSVAQEGGRP
jgi:RNA polymerase sigma-70 factor (ECF subfamily)